VTAPTLREIRIGALPLDGKMIAYTTGRRYPYLIHLLGADSLQWKEKTEIPSGHMDSYAVFGGLDSAMSGVSHRGRPLFKVN
jgi:hypothetical protein